MHSDLHSYGTLHTMKFLSLRVMDISQNRWLCFSSTNSIYARVRSTRLQVCLALRPSRQFVELQVTERDSSAHCGEPFAGFMQLRLEASCSRGCGCCAIEVAKVDKISWIHQEVLCIASIIMSCQEP